MGEGGASEGLGVCPVLAVAQQAESVPDPVAPRKQTVRQLAVTSLEAGVMGMWPSHLAPVSATHWPGILF